MMMVMEISDQTLEGCIGDTPENHVDNGDDCDDENEHAWSVDSMEICDTFDNNCDGGGENGAHQIDEGVTVEFILIMMETPLEVIMKMI